jgi:RHS repeat-associated protein
VPANHGVLFYVHNDPLGTPQALTDEAGAVIWRAEYDPFGKATVDEDPDNDGNGITLNVRFPGQYYDQETRLHYNYFRYYDPSTGRYISSDPMGVYGGLNTYEYVENNPLYWYDPLGLEPRGRNNTRSRNRNHSLYGPFGPICGPENSPVLASWIPDLYTTACKAHDKCYLDCATQCNGEWCRLICDWQLFWDNPLYGFATGLRGGGTYNQLLEDNNCNSCK